MKGKLQRPRAGHRHLLYVIGVFVVAQILFLSFTHETSAAALSSGRDHLSRNKASLTSGIDHIVIFTTSSTNGTENKVKLTFPDADDGLWCRTAGTDLVVTTSTEDSATGLPGTLTGACTQGSGGSSFDTITVSGVSDLSTSTRYGVKISDGSIGKLGTPTAGNDKVITLATQTSGSATIDTQNIAESIISDDQITVSAVVDASLTFSLDTNSAALGTLSATTINKAAVVSTVSTSGFSGFTSYVNYDHKLRIDVSNDVDDESGGGTIVAGTEEFGVSTSEGTAVDIAGWSPASCSTGATTSNATALSATAKTYATATVGVFADATTVCFLATIGSSTTAGSYSSTATLVTVGKF